MAPLILIAEDNPEIRGLLRLYLEGEGLRVLEAENGDEALAKARAETPDLAILDVMMPGLSGYEVTRALRRFSEMPILILSAKSEDNDKILGLNLGADDYVTKPFNPVEVVARVKAQLRRAARAGRRAGAGPGQHAAGKGGPLGAPHPHGGEDTGHSDALAGAGVHQGPALRGGRRRLF